jgi:hypothetical protein
MLDIDWRDELQRIELDALPAAAQDLVLELAQPDVHDHEQTHATTARPTSSKTADP